jgi:putative heme-binding domain-containing protein
LKVSGQLDLWQMLHPAIQPGSKLDYEPAPEVVTLTFKSRTPLTLTAAAPATITRVSETESTLHVTATKTWIPFELTVATDTQAPSLSVTYHTNEDARERAMMRRRFQLPFAVPVPEKSEPRTIPEIAGGNWNDGKALFFSKVPGCFVCHTKDGEGGKVAPDLSNLIHRDFESVNKDIRQPSAAINPDYLQYTIKLEDGKVLNGIVTAASESEIKLGDASGQTVAIPRASIKSMLTSKQSLMPEGLLEALNPQQVKDLFTYLLSEPPPPPKK